MRPKLPAVKVSGRYPIPVIFCAPAAAAAGPEWAARRWHRLMVDPFCGAAVARITMIR
jgi:hypothetical protein